MSTPDPRWEGVRGGIAWDEIWKARRLEIQVRRHGHVVSQVALLTDNPAELRYALDRAVRAIDEALHA